MKRVYITTSFLIALAVFAVLTGAMHSLKKANAFFLTLSVLFFLFSLLTSLRFPTLFRES